MSFESPMFYNALPFFFKMALGAVTTTAKTSPAYEHVFNTAKILPSFTTEIKYDTAGQKQIAGCKVNTLNINAKAGESATVSMEALGLATTKLTAATVSGLPADDNVAHFSHATVSFTGSANTEIISMDLGIDNGLEAIATLNGTYYPSRINEGVRKITCGMEMDFTSQTMYDLAVAGTAKHVLLTYTSIVLAATGFPFSIAVSLPNVKFASVSSPVAADGVISQKLDTVVLYDGTDTHDIRITVVNTDVSYPTPTS